MDDGAVGGNYPRQSQQPQQQQQQQSSTMQQQQQQTQTVRQSSQILSSGIINGPRTVILQRHNGDFGFTLRHFIVYPPDVTDPNVVHQLEAAGVLNFVQPMDTIFVKKVHPESQAFYAGLKEGDRLLAVNGCPVAGNAYADVVNAIQKTPKTLTLQVVPKCYDILQTYFSDTAHNPETNQRPQPQVLQQPPSSYLKPSTMSTSRLMSPQPTQSLLEKQESPYSTLQDLSSSRKGGYLDTHQKFLKNVPLQQNTPQPQSLQMYKQKENIPQINLYGVDMTSPNMAETKSLLSNASSDLSECAVMNRMRKSLEQKEEFLRRPSQPYSFNSLPPLQQMQMTQKPAQQESSSTLQREFYARPNRLKPIWPPNTEFGSTLGQPKMTITSTSSQDLTSSGVTNNMSYSNSRLSNQLALREQFFNSTYSPPPSTFSLIKSASPTPMFSSTPTSPHLLEQSINHQSISGSAGNIIEKSISNSLNSTTTDTGDKRLNATPSPVCGSSSSSVPVLRIVDNLTKQFESGRPLSPDGIDRTAFHKSELSRLNTKQAVPNVALRRQVFEMKAENATWRRSTDEKQRSSSAESDSRRTSIRTRSLSAESSKTSTSNNTAKDRLEVLGDERGMRPKPMRENSYLTAVRNNPDAPQVVLRPKLEDRQQQQMIDEEDRKTRRISYLKATANDIDSDVDNSPVSQTPDTPDDDANAIANQLKSAYRPWRRPRFTTDIQPLRRLFEESPPSVNLPPIIETISRDPNTETSSETVNKSIIYTTPPSNPAKSKALTYFRDQSADASAPITREGTLNVKVTLIDGKRSQDRTWRTVQAELKGSLLKLTVLREGKLTEKSPEPYGGTIDLSNFHVSDGNYTKRKNVFRLSSANYPSSSSSQTPQQLCGYERELLIQAQNPQDMALWMSSMKNVCKNSRTSSAEYLSSLGSQTAEPQRIAAVQSVQLNSAPSGTDEVSPVLQTKTVRKYLGSRSPSGQSPVTKSRKTPQNFSVSSSSVQTSASSSAVYSKDKENSDRETGSPKQKSWKNFVTQQFKKIQNQPDSGSGMHQGFPVGASIGVPLPLCPPSEENVYVPLLVAKCTTVVETKGLNIVGIYRIPGNTAAISALSERVNQNGMDEQTWNDSRFDDVNVVSSLLKLFIRSLPEPLLPNELYSSFINADKLTDQVQRFNDIKMLLKKLPPHNYETLKHLIKHLNRVSQNCLGNLMEPRNLAIVFGPSIVRKSNDSIETAVKDMKHQCCIVESLVTHYLFFFENDSLPKLKEKDNQSIAEPTADIPSAEFLLENVAKIEPFNKESSKDSSSRFMANIVQAANRKIRRTAQRRSTTSSVTPDTLSLDSTTSTESKEQSLMKQYQRYHNETKTINVQSNESLLSAARSSEEDSNDSAFTDNGSMSLTTVTALLDNKLRSLRNSSVDSEKDVIIEERPKMSSTQSASPLGVATTSAQQANSTTPQRPHYSHSTFQSNSSRPLTLGENIPFADESPERPLIQARIKPIRVSYKTSVTKKENATPPQPTQQSPTIQPPQISIEPPPIRKDLKNDSIGSSSSTLSEDTDASTTSNPRDISSIRLDTEVLRKVNRILTNLEHLERKYSLNRSLSLNYKNHRNIECCCNHNHQSNINNNHNGTIHGNMRLSLTKDEKTDKNINKRRQLYDSNQNNQQGNGAVTRRRGGSRSIRRRHTVGGTQDYYPNAKMNAVAGMSPRKRQRSHHHDDSVV